MNYSGHFPLRVSVISLISGSTGNDASLYWSWVFKIKTNKESTQSLWIIPEKCWVGQMVQLQAGWLLSASSFGSTGGKVQRIFWEGTSNKLPETVGSHSLLMHLELRAEALEAKDLYCQPPSQVCLPPGESSLSPSPCGGRRVWQPQCQTLRCPACQESPLVQTFFPSHAK